jgi:hypothetical protein
VNSTSLSGVAGTCVTGVVDVVGAGVDVVGAGVDVVGATVVVVVVPSPAVVVVVVPPVVVGAAVVVVPAVVVVWGLSAVQAAIVITSPKATITKRRVLKILFIMIFPLNSLF